MTMILLKLQNANKLIIIKPNPRNTKVKPNCTRQFKRFDEVKTYLQRTIQSGKEF